VAFIGAEKDTMEVENAGLSDQDRRGLLRHRVMPVSRTDKVVNPIQTPTFSGA
jgi:hypothetical protein